MKPFSVPAFLGLSFLLSWVHGEISTDGSVGLPADILTSTDGVYTINQSLGQLSENGDNLFHSFLRFGLDAGEIALFTGDDTIKNVISRVTGGERSNIDGIIRSTVGKADFYFINPAGVLFGPNAQLDLQGAFHVSTADYVRLGDNDLFYSKPLKGEVLSTAAPAAFGFLDDSVGTITVNGAALELSEGETLSLVGGDIEVNSGAELNTTGGQVNLISVASAGEASFASSASDLDISSLSDLGAIAVKEISTIGVSGPTGGRVFIRGGQVVVEDSHVYAQTFDNGDGQGAGIDIVASEQFELIRSLIDTRAFGDRKAGDISVGANLVTIDNRFANREVGIFSGGISESFNVFLDIVHSYTSDLIGKVISPTGTVVTLFSGVGDGGDNFTDTRFDDFADSSISDASGPFTGSFRPEELLSGFADEDFVGEWILRIEDTSFGDGGSLNVWGLGINGQRFESTDVSVTIDNLSPNVVESALTVSQYNRVVSNTFNAGSITLNVNRIDLLGDVSLDASVTAGTNGTIDVSAEEITLDGVDATFSIDSGIGMFERNNIVLDGTFKADNDGLILTGPEYSILQEYGETRGSNLFHSFRTFLVDGGETATFEGDIGISNILVRVTGDLITDIRGTMRSAINGSNLYFFNPNGISFGENASIDLTGSFHISTADYLSLSDGGVFDVSNPSESVLSNDKPGAFGFLGINNSSSVVFDGSEIAEESKLEINETGASFSVVSKSIWIKNFVIDSDRLAGLYLIAVGSEAGEVELNPSSQELPSITMPQSDWGDITFTEGSRIRPNNGADTYVRANRFVLEKDSRLEAINAEGNIQPGIVDVRVNQLDFLNVGVIQAETWHPDSPANDIHIEVVGKTTIDAVQTDLIGNALTGFRSGSGANFDFNSDGGNAGTVTFKAAELEMRGGLIRNSSYGQGDAGAINIEVSGQIIMKDGAQISAYAAGTTQNTHNQESLGEPFRQSPSVGKGGDIIIDTGSLLMDSEATILAKSHAFDFRVPGKSAPSEGLGGNVSITTGQMQIQNGANISVSAFGSGDAGSIKIQADDLQIFNGRIRAVTRGSGAGGDLSLMVNNQLNIAEGGFIDIATFSDGNAGNATIRASDIIIDGDADIMSTGIFSDSLNAFGNGGNLFITADNLLKIVDNGRIDSSTNFAGGAGSTVIRGGDLIIENNGQILSTASVITSVANFELFVDQLPDAGFIDIRMEGDIVLSNNTTISSSSEVTDAGTVSISAGGNVEIDSSVVSISAGQGVLDGAALTNDRFTLDDPDSETLGNYLSEFELSTLKISSGGTLRIGNNSEIDASAGLLAGSVQLTAADEIIIDQSTVSLEVDQRGMNLASIWESYRDEATETIDGTGFANAFPKLFSNLTLAANDAIRIFDSNLTTNAGLAPKALDLANGYTSKVRGFGGSIEMNAPLVFPTLIELAHSTLEARSYTMGGNVIIDPYYYVVNNSAVITSADVIGGNYIIHAAFLLQSLDSIVDLSGQQSGSFISSAVDVDLGSDLLELKTEFLNLESFVQASCDLYYTREHSSFIINPAKIQLSDFGDYLPSGLPDHLDESVVTPTNLDNETIYNKSLPRPNNDCIDCI